MPVARVNLTAATPLPVTVGRLLDFPHDPLACMRRMYATHGRVSALEEDGQRLVFAFGPELNQQLLSDPKTYHARFFAIRGPRDSAQRRLTGALLSMNGDAHKRHRRLVMGPFQKKSVERYRDAQAALALELVESWRPGTVRDVAADMIQYMLRVTSSILFGYDVPELAEEIGRCTERWVAMNHRLGIGAFVSDSAIAASYDRILALAEELEAQVRRMIAVRRSSAALGEDVLSLLIRAHDEAGTGMTDDELVGQSAILFAAAHLTTAYSLSWTLFLLAQHPGVAADLQDELTAVLHGDPPTVEQLDRLPLLDRVIKESMRVLPASAYSQRVNVEPVTVGPFRVRTGTILVFSQFITHHMAELYPEPERFRPERWETINPSPYAYMPFAAGPRMCLGAPLAMATLKITLPTILQRYRLRVVPGAEVTGKVTSTMLAPVRGLPMLVGPRTAGFRRSPVRGNIHELVTLE